MPIGGLGHETVTNMTQHFAVVMKLVLRLVRVARQEGVVGAEGHDDSAVITVKVRVRHVKHVKQAVVVLRLLQLLLRQELLGPGFASRRL